MEPVCSLMDCNIDSSNQSYFILSTDVSIGTLTVVTLHNSYAVNIMASCKLHGCNVGVMIDHWLPLSPQHFLYRDTLKVFQTW